MMSADRSDADSVLAPQKKKKEKLLKINVSAMIIKTPYSVGTLFVGYTSVFQFFSISLSVIKEVVSLI